MEEIKDYGQENINLILIGNKTDLEDQREVATNEARFYANERKMMFFETCAKKPGVKDCFLKIVTKIVGDVEKGVIDPYDERNGIRVGALFLGENTLTDNNELKNKKKKNKSSCC